VSNRVSGVSSAVGTDVSNRVSGVSSAIGTGVSSGFSGVSSELRTNVDKGLRRVSSALDNVSSRVRSRIGTDKVIWTSLQGSWSGGGKSYTLGTLGGHVHLNSDIILGSMVQIDRAEDPDNGASGDGWMVGPYLVVQAPAQPLYFEGRLLYGKTSNDIKPIGTYTDTFRSERWLALLRMSGEYLVKDTTLMPLLEFAHGADQQNEYTDRLGNLISRQSVGLSSVEAGVDFSTPVQLRTGEDFRLTGGLSGVYSQAEGMTSKLVFEDLRGKTHLGLNYTVNRQSSMKVGAFYDGLGSRYDSYGANLAFDMRF